jgi:enterochelin esterase-like enzyme
MAYRQGIQPAARLSFLVILLCLTALSGCLPVKSMLTPPLQAVPTRVIPSPSIERATPTIPPAPSATPTVSCAPSTGTVSRMKIQSKELPGELYFTLYLPPCYSDNNSYPVLYLFHGLSYKDDQWVRLGMTTAADRLIGAAKMKPVIIVMPYDPSVKDPPDSNFGIAVVESLIPWVDSHYNTCVDQKCRWVGGLSRGAGWAFYVFTTYPDLFGVVAGHSPAIFRSDPQKFVTSLSSAYTGQRIWLDIGNKDKELNYLIAVDSLLTDASIPHEFSINPGAHDEAYWSSHIDDYLRWYAGDQ